MTAATNPPDSAHHTQAPDVPIKGSWEDLLLQAQQLAARQDDAAIPQLQRIVDRLARLPLAQLTAADNRLHKILTGAAVDLQYYLTYRDRYAEALATNAQVRPFLAAQALPEWDRHSALVQIQAGAVDEGMARLQALAADGDLDQWSDLVFAAIEARRLDVAHAAIQGGEGWLNHRYQGQFTDAESKRDQAFLAYLRARVALADTQVSESVAWYQHASMLDSFFAENPQFLYTHLMDAGAYTEALPLIRRDRHNQFRAGFWLGLWHYRDGELTTAARHWQDVTELELPADGAIEYLELVLSYYYLGDRDGIGLGSVLNALRETPQFWGLFYLAGLGWAMRGDLPTARSNLQLAVMRRKSRAEGSRLAHAYWQFCADLLDVTQQQAIVEFFEHADLQRRA